MMSDGTLVATLREVCERFAERPALSFKPGFCFRRWTYGQMWQDVTRMASYLGEQGLKPGDRVLIWAPNCPQWVIGYFGSMMAGGIVIPMDLRVSEEFVERVISQTEPAFAIVSRVTPRQHERIDAKRVYAEEMDAALAEIEPDPAREDLSAEIAQVTFTSGTTGDPKGVMLTHANLLSAAQSAMAVIPPDPEYRTLSLLPLSHVFEQTGGLLLPLWGGSSITYATTRQPSKLLQLMQEARPTTILMVPLLLDLFMRGIERQVEEHGRTRIWSALLSVSARLPFGARRHLFRPIHKRFGGNLQFIVSGAAALAPETGRKWELVGVKILQGYGATEASPTISINSLEERRLDSVGKPLPGVDVKIAESGEIHVRGGNITPGYWQNDDATASAFEDGWYRTGDIGLLDRDGFLHIRGRLKEMIVLGNGMNVFPEDVEAEILKYGGIGEVCVVGLPRGGDTEVHAVFLPMATDDANAAVESANAALGEHQRIRGHTVWHEDDFPRTHTLKVRKNLVALHLAGSAGSDPSASPGSAAAAQEDQLAAIVAGVASVSTADLHAESRLGDDLDIDSLGRIELLSAIEEQLGVFIDESDIEAATTLRELRDRVDSGGSEGGSVNPHDWGTLPWVCVLRGVLQRTTMFPLLRRAYKIDVVGLHNLAGLEGQVIFAANHTISLDAGAILMTIPDGHRRRLAVVAGAHMWANPLRALAIPLFGNGFAFNRDAKFRSSLENTGRILDARWSLLIFPEGRRTDGGDVGPFLPGTGLLAVESRLPVVPVRLDVEKPGVPQTLPLLKRGRARVRFGKPIHISPATGYEEATRLIEESVRGL